MAFSSTEPTIEAPFVDALEVEEPSVEEPSVEERMNDDPFQVAVVMPSSINDLTYSQNMYEALVSIQSEMCGADKMELVYSEGMFGVDAAIRDDVMSLEDETAHNIIDGIIVIEFE